MTITDKQVEAACVSLYGEMEFSMSSEKLRAQYLAEMRAALEAAKAARDAGDFVRVPREPTVAMQDEGARAANAEHGRHDCASIGHVHAEVVYRAMIAAAPGGAEQPAETWRCFHCDEVFTDREQAAFHFGIDEMCTPACGLDGGLVEAYRRQELELRRYRDEDSDKDRQMHRQRNEHVQALQRAEEAGYAKALKDTNYQEPAPGAPEADERARFEVAMRDEPYANELFASRADGEYLYSKAELAWRAWQAARAQSIAAPSVAPVSAVTDEMVHRFLAWKLPETFSPDGGVRIDERWQKRFGWPPTGTNLFNKDEARAMLEHVLATSVAAVSAPADARDGEDARRYRWLRERRTIDPRSLPSEPWVTRVELVCGVPATNTCVGVALDAAIDRAMGAPGGSDV